MLLKILIHIFCHLTSIYLVYAQAPEPTITFHPPVKHTIRLSGTFGELRSNHFHGGLDIKSEKGIWGDPILAIDDGYIERITVSPSGYGNALYIRHPSGFSSLYGHLESFTPMLDSLVLEEQYLKKSFEVSIEPEPGQIPVVRGQQIGKMGSTGYSFGPHLHFEIHRTETGEIVNPLLYEFKVMDRTPPVFRSLSIYHLDHRMMEYGQKRIPIAEFKNGDTITADAWRVGFGVAAYDPFNGGNNKNGIFSLQVFRDKDLIFDRRFESLDRNSRRHFNAFIDFEAQVLRGEKIYRCYQWDHFLLPENNSGIVPIYLDRYQRISMIISDFHHNRDTLFFFINRADAVTPPSYPLFQYHLKAGIGDTIQTRNLELLFNKEVLYKDLYLQYESKSNTHKGAASPSFKVHHPTVPLRSEFILRIKPDSLSEREKLIMTRRDFPESKMGFVRSSWEEEWLVSSSRQLGIFQVVKDTVPPEIKNIKNVPVNGGRMLQFQISDRFPENTPLLYEATVDGEWILATYDLKNKSVTCRINRESWKAGKHNFKLIVKDAVGNTANYDYTFNLP